MRPSDVRFAIEVAEICELSPWSHRDYLDEMVRTDSILLKASTEDVAFAGFIVARRVPGNDSDLDAEIYNIGVDPSVQRHHIGSLLMTETLRLCARDKIANIWLEVRASNEGAIAFYTRFGFVKAGRRQAFYRDPVEDGITMKLSVSDYFSSHFRNIA
jgi:ribosomal-protein-alanine N-acetyltransferase